MAKAPKLKVFRTTTGFDDAYVAAPSRKAALAAWGSKHDLFARGIAEIVDDPELIKEPLAHPGVVIRRSRGNAEEQLAALGPALVAKKRPASPEEPEQSPHATKPAPRPNKVIARKPKPDRSALDEAERNLADVEKRHAQERAEMAQRQAELERQRKALKIKQGGQITELEQKVDDLRAKYERATRN